MDGKMDEIIEVLRLFHASDFTAMHLEFEGARIDVTKDGSQPPVVSAWPRQAAPETGPPPAAEPPTRSLQAPGKESTSPSSETPPAADGVSTAAGDEAGLVAVRAPMLGTFYRATSPGEPPFVEVGDKVDARDTVCIIECMKLFNTIEAGCRGTVVRIEAENGGMVEFDQPLIFVQPD